MGIGYGVKNKLVYYEKVKQKKREKIFMSQLLTIVGFTIGLVIAIALLGYLFNLLKQQKYPYPKLFNSPLLIDKKKRTGYSIMLLAGTEPVLNHPELERLWVYGSNDEINTDGIIEEKRPESTWLTPIVIPKSILKSFDMGMRGKSVPVYYLSDTDEELGDRTLLWEENARLKRKFRSLELEYNNLVYGISNNPHFQDVIKKIEILNKISASSSSKQPAIDLNVGTDHGKKRS